MAQSLFAIDSRKGKISFLNQGNSEHVNHTPGQDPHLETAEQHRLDPIVLVSFHMFVF